MLKLSLICPESSCNETINGDMEHIINKIRFAFSSALLALMVIFLIVFPKGGVKIGGIPLTFGYMFFAITAVYATIVNTISGRLAIISGPRLAVFYAMLVFQSIAALTIVANGYENFGFVISILVNLFHRCFRTISEKLFR